MASRPRTPSTGAYGSSVPAPQQSHLDRGYGSQTQLDHFQNNSTGVSDFATGNPNMSSPLAAMTDPPGSVVTKDETHPLGHHQHDATTATTDGGVDGGLGRSASSASTAYNRDTAPSRSGTLKKKNSVLRKSSLRRSGSRKSLTAGSVKGVGFAGETGGDEYNSALYTPVPTHGSPTEVLANRFQAWRTLLKSLITYFREVQSSYDHRGKALMKVSNVIQNMQHPSVFITDGGLQDATRVLSDYHKHSLTEANKSRDIEADVIQALTGLRADLAQKIKEIKSLSGDFKNTVDKEKEGTKKAVAAYSDALDHADTSDAGKSDPYLVKLSVDRAIERQIDEENYLHRAYLNLETSGRELESIIVGEIQKSYNALAGILKREGDDAYSAVETLRTGPIAMPKDMEWSRFVENDPNFVNPRLPLRKLEDISYPGKHDPSASEIRAGMLERKSKYLKSYTPGWYVLSPTYLHEFKSADKIYSQPPVMSLYLPDQKLGSHSSPGSSSHKFMLKGRQSGGMHRGHSWVFRAESYETMMAWFEALKVLTEKTAEERHAYVRQHAQSMSGNEHRPSSISSDGDGLEEDEADKVPYSASVASSIANSPVAESKPKRPVPGGRFPSDINVNRNRAISPSTESEPDHDAIAAAAALPGGVALTQEDSNQQYEADPYRLEGVATSTPAPVGAAVLSHDDRDRQRSGVDKMPVAAAQYDTHPVDGFNNQPAQNAYPSFGQQQQHQQYQQPTETQTFAMPIHEREQPLHQVQSQPDVSPLEQHAHQQPPVNQQPHRQNTNYAEWLAPVAAGAGAGALGTAAYNKHKHHDDKEEQPLDRGLVGEPEPAEDVELPLKSEDRLSSPTTGSFVPIPTTTNTIAHHEAPRAVDGAEWPDRTTSLEPSVTGTHALPTSTTGAANAGAYNDNSGISGDIRALAATATETMPYADYVHPGEAPPLGGLEGKGAHNTGKLFPAVVRHESGMSVSQLHVPGEFPPTGSDPQMRGGMGPRTTTAGSFVAPSGWDMARE